MDQFARIVVGYHRYRHGTSFGNNFNNRSEEALGNATDLWAAYEEGAFKASERRWLGYR
jgi:Restriction endonuclease XhoI